MPIYEYRCTRCDYLFEELKCYSSKHPKCPNCDGETQRIMSSPSFKLKGTGFHDTDYSRLGPKRK